LRKRSNGAHGRRIWRSRPWTILIIPGSYWIGPGLPPPHSGTLTCLLKRWVETPPTSRVPWTSGYEDQKVKGAYALSSLCRLKWNSQSSSQAESSAWRECLPANRLGSSESRLLWSPSEWWGVLVHGLRHLSLQVFLRISRHGSLLCVGTAWGGFPGPTEHSVCWLTSYVYCKTSSGISLPPSFGSGRLAPAWLRNSPRAGFAPSIGIRHDTKFLLNDYNPCPFVMNMLPRESCLLVWGQFSGIQAASSQISFISPGWNQAAPDFAGCLHQGLHQSFPMHLCVSKHHSCTHSILETLQAWIETTLSAPKWAFWLGSWIKLQSKTEVKSSKQH
jgi:hypothetical protein